jgi:hypothetical protein
MSRFAFWPFQPTTIAFPARRNFMDDDVAEFVNYLKSEPGLLDEFLEGHAADNRWPWQRLYWWCHLRIFLIRTQIFGEGP